MYDLISIGGIVVDFYFKSNSLTFNDGRFQLAIGGKYIADFFTIRVGGGGINVAVGASKNGLKTAVLGIIGDNFFKPIILQRLRRFRISHQFCNIVKNYYSFSTILLTEDGERSVIHFATPCHAFLNHKIKISQLREAKMVYLGNFAGLSLEIKLKILQFLRKNSVLNIVNLGVRDCRRPKNELLPLLKHVDILILNDYEFAELVKAPYEDIYFHEDVVNHYIPVLRSRLVIITMGKKGSFGYFQGKVYHQRAVEVEKIVDTTGCGDGYTAGFIAEYSHSKNIEKAMEKGAKYAAKILGRIGAN